jgi:energy-coupling factor transporter ATP-binding protein EcfA2
MTNGNAVSGIPQVKARAEGPWSNLALETIGWKAFQDLCSQVCEEILKRPVQIYREAQDGGQDAVFSVEGTHGSVDATVQCKYTSDARRRLKATDIAGELVAVGELVTAGQADTYVLLTSMGVDAKVGVTVRNALRAQGVRKPHVFGREYLVRAIRSSARLRALVPQVYGLGDLGAILDQRVIQQTRALLENWIPKLKCYVPTAAHRNAVKSLSSHGLVLLLGNPASGKSTIGAILSTIASENSNHTVLHLTSPRDFEANWNPADPGRFFWIDDAFGANSMRDEYVKDWTTTFGKLQAAISHGNRFVLTSRRHIYEAARPGLGHRSHPEILSGRAVVDVGDLTEEEKAQILYNHVSFGGQTQSWKRSVRDKLDAVARVDRFLPGIAERLGDPAFTKGLGTTRAELIRFMEEPREHLIDTINALDEPLRAALILVYVHQGKLQGTQADDEASKWVASNAGQSIAAIYERMGDLRRSFLSETHVNGLRTWQFAHPTISDALTVILKDRSHMVVAFIRGAPIETIMNGFVCEGAKQMYQWPIIPATQNEVLVKRLRLTENKGDVNRSLFAFLANRASDDLLRRLLELEPEILSREATSYYARVSWDPRLETLARAHRLGLLSEELRDEAARQLTRSAISEFDLSFLEDDDMLSLIPSSELLSLGIRLMTEVLPRVDTRIKLAHEIADLSDDPESHFERFTEGLRLIEDLGATDGASRLAISGAQASIKSAIEDLEQRIEARKEADQAEKAAWSYMAQAPHAAVNPSSGDAKGERKRSIFSDVDGPD